MALMASDIASKVTWTKFSVVLKLGQVEPFKSLFFHIENQPLLLASVFLPRRGFVHQLWDLSLIRRQWKRVDEEPIAWFNVNVEKKTLNRSVSPAKRNFSILTGTTPPSPPKQNELLKLLFNKIKKGLLSSSLICTGSRVHKLGFKKSVTSKRMT